MAVPGRTHLPVLSAPPEGPTCRAPAVAMHFTITGEVHACCQNGAYEFGDVRTQTLGEIWGGLARRSMADALAGGRYPVGCEGCAVEHALGNRELTPAPPFDDFPDGDHAWPRQLEFTLSNRCNLACVQCNGDNSSTIRKREGLPPIPVPYGDRFFEELVPFLDHVEVCAFLGGEPFLTPEAKRVWDLLLASGRSPVVQVTTNATVWTSAVERYVNELRMDLAMSIDGATKETYEAIRLGARWDRVVEVRNRMIAAMRSYGGRPQLNFCLLRANWHELGLYLRQADELDVDANVIPVWGPVDHSLFTLDREELAPIVDRLEDEDRGLRGELGRNADRWSTTVAMLRDQLERLGSPASRSTAHADVEAEQRRLEKIERRRLEAEARRMAEEDRRRDVEGVARRVEAELAAWAGRPCIAVDLRDGLIDTVTTPAWADPLDPQQWIGSGPEGIADRVAAVLGPVSTGDPSVEPELGGATVFRTDSVVSTAFGPVMFRSAHVSFVERLFVATRDDLGPALLADSSPGHR